MRVLICVIWIFEGRGMQIAMGRFDIGHLQPQFFPRFDFFIDLFLYHLDQEIPVLPLMIPMSPVSPLKSRQLIIPYT